MSAVAAPVFAPATVVDPGRTATLGMWIFLGTELLFFGGLLVAYAYGRTHWPQGFAVASRHTDVVLGTVNTAVLLTSSAVVAFAVVCSEHPAARRWAARALWLTAALGIVFLTLKGLEYAHEWREQLFPLAGFALADAAGAELFFVLYFVMTGLHGLHLLIGIAGVATFAWASNREKAWASPPRIEAMALYWHFVDVVWIVLYPLLYLVERHA
jgi:cytochrome c oxidase subunit III